VIRPMACSNSSFTFSVSRQTNPSLSFTRRINSSFEIRSACVQYSTSQLAFKTYAPLE
jgi:hypothetical protein